MPPGGSAITALRWCAMHLTRLELTNFRNYVDHFADSFGCEKFGEGRPMQAATNQDGLTIVNFGIGSPNAATIMDLLSATKPRGVLFLGKCGGLKKSAEIGNFILPIAAIRGEGTSDDYLHPKVPGTGSPVLITSENRSRFFR